MIFQVHTQPLSTYLCSSPLADALTTKDGDSATFYGRIMEVGATESYTSRGGTQLRYATLLVGEGNILVPVRCYLLSMLEQLKPGRSYMFSNVST